MTTFRKIMTDYRGKFRSVRQAAMTLAVTDNTLASWIDGLHFPPTRRRPSVAHAVGITLLELNAAIALQRSEPTLRGAKIHFAGALDGMTRRQAEVAAMAAGASAIHHYVIPHGTTLVVVGDEAGASSYRAKADALGLTVIDEAAFVALLGVHAPDSAERVPA